MDTKVYQDIEAAFMAGLHGTDFAINGAQIANGSHVLVTSAHLHGTKLAMRARGEKTRNRVPKPKARRVTDMLVTGAPQSVQDAILAAKQEELDSVAV